MPILKSETRKGEAYILFGAFFWSLFPIAIVLSYSSLSGLISLAWSTLIAAIFFATVMFFRRLPFFIIDATYWKYLVGVTFFNGSLFYIFYYVGLESTTPGNASLIGLTEILTSFLFFNVFRKEFMSKEHKVGAVIMALGALLILFKGFSSLNFGDIFIFLAMCCGPIGNYYQQKARKIASAENILFWRSIISAPLIFLLAFFLNNTVQFSFNFNTIIFLLINGIIMLGLTKITWVEGIHRIPVTKAISFGALCPLLTMFFSWLILEQSPTIIQLLSFIPLAIGTLLLTDNLKLSWTKLEMIN